jgi:ferric-dicitrate binding protein FerR (iron transport regulator)
MAEFQWWLLIVGLVAGGGLVAIVSMDGRRREEDLADLERRAEAGWIASRLNTRERDLDAATVQTILRMHREYLTLPPPDRIEVGLGGRYPDRDPDEVRHDGSGRADQDLPRA